MSALFDEWAYQEVFAAPPQPAVVAVAGSEKPATRPRAVSIVKSVAALTIDVPAPQVRRRANSAVETVAAADETEKTVPRETVDTPLTRRNVASKWNREKWLGSADPSYVGFDEQFWRARVAEYEHVKGEAELAVRLAEEAQWQASSLSREIDWIVSQLDDARTHDLEPLRAAAVRATEISAKQYVSDELKQALSQVWEAQDRTVRLLRGPAPRVMPKLEQTIKDIDTGLKFCEDHPDFVGIEQTAQVWHTAAIRLIGVATAYSTHELRKFTQRISEKIKGSSGVRNALIYGKYASDLAHIGATVRIVRSHATTPDAAPEMKQSWAQLQSVYFGVRTDLVEADARNFAEPLAGLSLIDDTFSDAARQALVQFKQLYESEKGLYEELLGEVTPEFWQWLSDLSDPLYAVMRRAIVHETDIGRLCQLIILVHSEGGSATDDSETIVDTVSYQDTPAPSSKPRVPIMSQEEASEDPFDAVYKDAQNRLVFRANMIIDGFSRYEPGPKDFVRSRYPTVDQAINLLGQVYQLLNSQVFNDLAHRCVQECLVSLDMAVANRVSQGHDTTEVHLFHIKQLLLLQLQIVDLDLENTVIQEVDFSGIRNLLELPRGHSIREMISLAWESMPRVVEIMCDALEEVYASLRRSVVRLCLAFVNEVQIPKGSSKAAEENTLFRERVSTKFQALKVAISKFISDPAVAAVLIDSTREAVREKYMAYYGGLAIEDRSGEAVMDPDTFANWLSATIADQNSIG